MDGKAARHDNFFVERLWWTINYEEFYLGSMPACPKPGPGEAVDT
jgi:hypothetical protein